MTLRIIAIVFTIVMLGLAATPSQAKPPAFYHYYYVFPESMSRCQSLINEVFRNTDRNWDFTRSNVNGGRAFFSVRDIRGSMRCLSISADRTWVVVVTAGNDRSGDRLKTKDLFDELLLGICGRCSALAQ